MPRKSRGPTVSDGNGQTSVLSETVIPLGAVSEHLPNVRGERPVASITIYKWVTLGVKGVRLESARIGIRLVTSVEAVERFLDRLAQL